MILGLLRLNFSLFELVYLYVGLMCSVLYLIVAQIGANIVWSYRVSVKKLFNNLKRQILLLKV